MAAKYGVYWRTANESYWTLALPCDTPATAERLKCQIMGKPRGRFTVERTTVIDFPLGGALPTFVMVGKEHEARSQPPTFTPNWKPAGKGRAKASVSAAQQPPRPPYDELVDGP